MTALGRDAPAATRPIDDDQMRISLRLARMLVETMGGSMDIERAAMGKARA